MSLLDNNRPPMSQGFASAPLGTLGFGSVALDLIQLGKCHTERTKPLAHCGEVFDRCVAQASTYNSVNAVLIAFENRMSPHEEAAVFRHILGYSLGSSRIRHMLTALRLRIIRAASGLARKIGVDKPMTRSEQLQRWAHSLWQHSRMANVTRPVELSPRWHRCEVSFFARNNRSDHLIVALSGGQARFGMRAPTLLRFFDQLDADVLLVRPRHSKKYADGVSGLGDTLYEAMESIADVAANYGRVTVTGISKGAPIALILGGHLGATRIVVLGLPRIINDVDVRGLAKNVGDEGVLRRGWATALESIPSVVVFGTGAKRDQEASENLVARSKQARLVEIPFSPHAMLWPLAKRGELAEALNDWIFGEITPETAAVTSA